MYSSRRPLKKNLRRFLGRCVIAAPLMFSLLVDRADAETYELECREVEVDWSGDPVWLCKRDWFADGSRISDDQRKSVNVLVVSSLMFPKGRKR